MNIFKKIKLISSQNILLILLFAATLLRTFYLNQSIWLDEAFSLYIAKLPLSKIPMELASDNGAPLYFVLLHFWIKIFGISEIAIRSLSLLFSLINILVVYKFFIKSNTKTALISVLLISFSAFHIYYAEEARPYALEMLFSTISLILFYRFLDKPKSFFPLLGIANGLLILTHYWGFFLIVSQALFLFIFLLINSKTKEKTFQEVVLKIKDSAFYFLCSLLTSFLFFVPWLSVFFQQMGNQSTSWIPSVESKLPILPLKSLFFFSNNYFVAFLCIGILIYWIFQKKEKPFVSFFLAFFLLVPLIIAQIFTYYKPIYMANRHDSLTFIFFWMFFATLIVTLKKKPMFLLLFLLLISELYAIKIQFSKLKSADRIVADFLLQDSKKEDLLIFTHLARLPFQYYYDQSGKSLEIINYPSLISDHAGYVDGKLLAENRGMILQEAEEYSDLCLEKIINQNSCYIIFYQGDSTGNNKFLYDLFEDRFGKPEEIVIPERQQFYPEVIYKFTKSSS